MAIADVGLMPPAQTGAQQAAATWGTSAGPNAPQNETDQQRNKRLQQQLMDAYTNAGPGQAPQSTAAQAAQASQAGYQAAGSGGSSSYTPYSSEQAPGAQQAQYNAYQAATAGPAAQAEMTRLGQAQLVGAPRINAVTADYVGVPTARTAGDVTVGYTAGGAAGQTIMPSFIPASYSAGVQDVEAAKAQQAELANNDALRQRQMDLLDYLQGSAMGTNGPSAAEMQFQRNLDKSIAAQHAQAAGAVGTGRVSANLQSGYNIGELSQDAAAQSAMLRATEQQQARAQLLSGLESTRGQDLSVAGLQQQVNLANAGFGQQANLANAQNRLSNNQYNAGLEQQSHLSQQDLIARVGMSNAGLSTQANLADAQIQAARAQQQAAINSQQGMFNAGEGNTSDRMQAQLEASRGQFNAGQTNQVNTAQAQLGLQAGTFNAGAQNAFTSQQAGLNSAERLFNAGAENQVNMFNTGQQNAVGMSNAQNQNQVGMFNAGQGNAVNMFNTGQANQVGLANAQNSLQNSQFNIGQSNQLGMFNAGQFNNNSQFNAGQTNQGNQFNAGLQNQVNIQNTDATLRQRALDDANKQALMNQYLAANGQLMNANQFNASTDEQRKARVLGMIGNGLAAGGGLAATLVSDERAKTDVQPLYSDERGKDKKKLLDSYDQAGGGGDDVGKLLDNLKAYKYRYKDPTEPGTVPGERYGIMAQDLEKSPMGASIVIDDGGRKKIDPAQAVGVLLAAMARMNTRVKKVEGRR